MTDRRSASSPSTEGSSSTQDSLGSAAEVPNRLPSERTLERLDARRVASHRYRIDGEIGRGGMGAILRVWDEDLRRHLAMKVILGHTPEGGPGDSQRLARFLEEAQVTGQLDHPGIVPVHELGRDERGQVYFTMHLVKGMHFGEVIRRARQGQDGWNATRALLHLHRVAEALAFAHERRVLHRDIKPTNVMVGRHGETFVMDWGLARVLDAPESKSIQLAGEPAPTLIQSDRHSGAADDSLCTMDGDVVGTPAYMSPEQARGEIDHLGPATDIYSLGAVLYELLAGHAPYGTADGRHGSPRVVWRRVLDGPPAPLREVAPAAQPELVAIAERAMARNAADRYASMQELADDLRAYLEGRVVRAHAVGPWREFVKWVQRNQSTAAVAAALLAVVLASGFLVAATERARATERSAFADRREISALLAETDGLRALHPDRAEACRNWLRRARDLVERWSGHELALPIAPPGWEYHPAATGARQIAADREFAHTLRLAREKYAATFEVPGDPAGTRRGLAIQAALRAWLEREHHRLGLHFDVALASAVHGPGSDEHFAAQLAQLSDLRSGAIAAVEQCLDRIEALVGSAARHREAWQAIAGPHPPDSPYPGLVLPPQEGLVPLGTNPTTGLLEFWVEASGDAPVRRDDGTYSIGEEHGIVLVLLPTPTAPVRIVFRDTYDDVQLAMPFFLSRYELTVAQWERLGGARRSAHAPGWVYEPASMTDLSHPVESVSWRDGVQVLAHVNLRLPSEAEWLFGARGDRPGEHWFDGQEGVLGRANLMGEECLFHKFPGTPLPLNDGFAVHAPVDSFAPNPFGLHSVHGNVAEWTADEHFVNRIMYTVREGPSQLPRGRPRDERVVRGGGFSSDLEAASFSARSVLRETNGDRDIGLRPARSLDP